MKSLNVKIYNYSKFIKTDEMIKCLNLLPDEYKELDNNIFIFESYLDYSLFCIKHFDFLSLSICMPRYMFRLFTQTDIPGFYSIVNKNVFIIEKTILSLIDTKLNIVKTSKEYSEYATDDVLNNCKFMWLKFIVLDTIVHEITHALQHHKKNIWFSIKKILIKWENSSSEYDAVKSSISIFSQNYNEFISILNVKGIEINHSLSPLSTSYKYYIKL